MDQTDDAGAAGGPPEGFAALYAREWAAITALGWSLTGSWAAAEELAQDAFIDAYRRWDEIGDLDRPGAWVRRAVVNRAASHHRHAAVERRTDQRLRADASAVGEGPDRDRTGDAATARVPDAEFWAAVRELSTRQARAMALRYVEDRTTDDVADILGCRPATVRVHLHRARQTLARRLSGDEAAEATKAVDDSAATESTREDRS